MHQACDFAAVKEVKEVSDLMKGDFRGPFIEKGGRDKRTARILCQTVQGNQGHLSSLPGLSKDMAENRDKKIRGEQGEHFSNPLEFQGFQTFENHSRIVLAPPLIQGFRGDRKGGKDL